MDREKLIHSYLEGTASVEEVSEIDRLVCEDPGFRRDLLAEGALDAKLCTGILWSADIFRYRQLFLRGRVLRSALTAAAATLVLGFGLVWYIGNIKPITVVITQSPVRIEKREKPPEVESPGVATVSGVELIARVTKVKGVITISSYNCEGVYAAAENSPIATGCSLMVSSNSLAEVEYDDGSRLILYGCTRVTFDPAVTGKLLRLDAGCVDASVVTQKADEPMRVYTDRLTVQVQGTEFRTIVDGNKSWVAVKSGSVLVYRHSDGGKAKVSSQKYLVDGLREWPFMALPVSCPVWKGECNAMAGNLYP